MPGKILLVDDNVKLQDHYHSELVKKGYEVITAGSVGEAISSLTKIKGIDLVLSDYNLQNNEFGTDIARHLRERLFSTKPFILMSGNDQVGKHIPRDLKIQKFWAKPLVRTQMETLFPLIEECMKQVQTDKTMVRS